MNCKSWMAVIAFVAVPLGAQQPGKPDSTRHPMMGPGQMGQMMGEPMMQQMGPAMKTTHEAAMAEAQTHMKQMEQAADAAAPDTSALKVHFQAAHTAMGKAHW